MLLDKDTILGKIKSQEFIDFIQKFNVSNVMVFGSLLTDGFNDESDVDIAILGDEVIYLDDILEIELFLEGFLERAIDVVDLRSSTLDIFVKINILNSSRVIYSTDVDKFEKYCDEVDCIYKENEDYFYFRKRDVFYE